MTLLDNEEIINNFGTLYWNILLEVLSIFSLLTFIFPDIAPSYLMFDQQYLVTTMSQGWFSNSDCLEPCSIKQ